MCNVHFVQSMQRTLLKCSSNINVFCGITSQNVYGPFFFAEGNLYWHDISGHVATVANATVAKQTNVHFPGRRKSRPLPLLGSSVPEHSVTKMLGRTCAWK